MSRISPQPRSAERMRAIRGAEAVSVPSQGYHSGQPAPARPALREQ